MDFKLARKPGDNEANVMDINSEKPSVSLPEGSHELCCWIPHPYDGFAVIIKLLHLRLYTVAYLNYLTRE